jgi:Concanavalin A-like lectin/glucanases superfamily
LATTDAANGRSWVSFTGSSPVRAMLNFDPVYDLPARGDTTVLVAYRSAPHDGSIIIYSGWDKGLFTTVTGWSAFNFLTGSIHTLSGAYDFATTHVVALDSLTTSAPNTTTRVYIDNRPPQVATTAQAQFPRGAFMFIGSQWYGGNMFQGDVGEVLIYNRVLTDDERTSIMRSLQAKWG